MKSVSRVVNTSFWEDDLILDYFTPEDRYFMLYLLTNPHTTQLGIYHLPLKQAAVELGYGKDSILSLLDRFENRYGILRFNSVTNEVAIKNFLRHSIVKGGKPVLDCLMKEAKGVSDKSLLSYVISNLINYTNINNTVKEFICLIKEEHKDIYINDNDNERIVNESSKADENDANNDSEDIVEIVKYLNEICGTHYKTNVDSTRSHIRARIKEGFVVDDFKLVIDKKSAEWLGTDMEKYLRPATLFGTKFESYLNQKAFSGSEKVDLWV